MDESIVYIVAPAAFFGTALLIVGLTFLKKSKVLGIATQEIEELLSAKPVDQRITEFQSEISDIEEKFESGSTTYKTLKITLSNAEEKAKQIEVGLYPPTFGFKDSEELKNLIRDRHTEQHRLIEADKAVGAHRSWTWYDDAKVGAEMVSDYKRLILRAFNSEFDALRKKLTYRNSEGAIDRIWKIREQLETLGETVGCYITAEYMEQKLAELSNWVSEILKQEKIKEETKDQKKILRESAKQEKEDTEEIEDEIEYRQSDLKRARKIAFELSGIDAESALA
jgi:septal ring factor EnvC (AmiA/AmiB activator)